MLKPIYTKAFEKDVKLAKKRGHDMDKLSYIMKTLLSGKPLPLKYRDHKLSGNYVDHKECHIEPDWLLIYRKLDNAIMFYRTGSHSDLF